MSPGPAKTLLISEVEKWKPERLGEDATKFASVVTDVDQLLGSMLTKQDEIAESWNGAGADSATTRVTNEKTAGSHIMGKVDAIKGIYTAHQTQLADAKNFVTQKRDLIRGMGFEVADDGNVTANAKIAAAMAASGNPDTPPGSVSNAIVQIKRDAAEQHVVMVSALQNADNTATSTKAALDLAKGELGQIAMYEVPPKPLRELYPGLLNPGAAKPEELPSVLGDVTKLQQGIPLTVTDPDGSTHTVTPNPDGTVTTSTSVHQPDGSTITTSSTDGKNPTTTVTAPRTDGSGIIDTTVTGADGKQQRLQTIPQGNGRSVTRAVNDDGSLGAKLSESYPAPNGGQFTEVAGPNGGFDREWKRPDGYSEIERYIPGPDGQPKLVGSSTSAGIQSTLNQDGSIDTKYSDGRHAKTITLEDGTVMTKFPDDSLLSFDPKQVEDGGPKSAWDSVRSWSTNQWDQAYASTQGTLNSHPYASSAGMIGDGAGEALARGGETMAGHAAQSAQRSTEATARAFSLLESGTPGAGRAVVDSMDYASDAASAASKAKYLANTAKFGGPALTAGLNIYTNIDDVVYDHKGVYEAVGNAAGGTAGGLAGAAGGAWLGAQAGALTGPGAGIAVPVLSVIGAIGGGFFGGQGGAYAGDKAGHGVRELFN